jgi:hypothetical protein
LNYLHCLKAIFLKTQSGCQFHSDMASVWMWHYIWFKVPLSKYITGRKGLIWEISSYVVCFLTFYVYIYIYIYIYIPWKWK